MTFNLQPFWEVGFATQIHVVCALAALFIGCFIFFRRKGTSVHKSFGKVWVALMFVVAVSSFFIHGLKTWGLFSPIHLLSVFTLGSLFWAIRSVRMGNIRAHKQTMIGLFAGGLVVAGLLTLSRGLLMHKIFLASEAGSYVPAPVEWPGGVFGFVFSIFVIVFVLAGLVGYRRNTAS